MKLKDVLTRIFGQIGVIVLVGKWKVGKTDFSLWIAEKLLKWNIVKKIASNIKTNHPDITFITNIQDLRRWLFADTTRKLFILDEVTVHLPRRRAMTRQNISALQILPEISKAKATLLLITHSLRAIDQAFLDETWLRAIIYKVGLKPNKEKTRYAIHHARIVSPLLPEGEVIIKNIPPTNIDFDPYAVAPFTVYPEKRAFSNPELQILWEWAVNKKPCRELGLHHQQLNRIVRRFVKFVLQKTEIFSNSQKNSSHHVSHDELRRGDYSGNSNFNIHNNIKYNERGEENEKGG